MTQFEVTTIYAGRKMVVKSDSFAEVHRALAGIEELAADLAYLQEQGVEDIVPDCHRDSEENEYFGLKDRHSRRSVTYGQKRDKTLFPFYPKGEDGYWNGQSNGHAPAPENGSTARKPPDAPPSRQSRDRKSTALSRSEEEHLFTVFGQAFFPNNYKDKERAILDHYGAGKVEDLTGEAMTSALSRFKEKLSEQGHDVGDLVDRARKEVASENQRRGRDRANTPRRPDPFPDDDLPF